MSEREIRPKQMSIGSISPTKKKEKKKITKNISRAELVRMTALNLVMEGYNAELQEKKVKNIIDQLQGNFAKESEKKLSKRSEDSEESEESESELDISIGVKDKEQGKKANGKGRQISHKMQEIRRLRRVIKFNDSIAALMSLLGYILASFEYEFYYEGKGVDPVEKHSELSGGGTMSADEIGVVVMSTRYQSSPLTTILRSCVTLTTVLVIFFLYLHMVYNHKLATERGKVTKKKSIYLTKYFRYFIIESIIHAIHCPPMADVTMSLYQIDQRMIISLNTILSTLMFIRFYLVLRLFVHYTRWKSEMASQYCEMESCDASTSFALKAVLKSSPYLTLFSALLASSWIFGTALRNFERPLNEYYGSNDYSFISNGMWLAVVTMTTVGFGDLSAQTHFGRLITLLTILWGLFLVSLLVVTLENTMELDPKETRSFNILYRIKSQENFRDRASAMIAIWWETMRCKIVYKEKLQQDVSAEDKALFKKNYEEQLAELLPRAEICKNEFNELKKLLKSADSDPVEEIRKLAISTDQDFHDIRKNMVHMNEIYHQLKAINMSHDVGLEVAKTVLAYTHSFDQQIIKFKGGVLSLKRYLKKERQGATVLGPQEIA